MQVSYTKIIAVSVGFYEDGSKIVGGCKDKAAKVNGRIHEQRWISKCAARLELSSLLQQDGVVA